MIRGQRAEPHVGPGIVRQIALGQAGIGETRRVHAPDQRIEIPAFQPAAHEAHPIAPAPQDIGQQQRLVGRVAAMRQNRAARPAKDAGIGLEADARGDGREGAVEVERAQRPQLRIARQGRFRRPRRRRRQDQPQQDQPAKTADHGPACPRMFHRPAPAIEQRYLYEIVIDVLASGMAWYFMASGSSMTKTFGVSRPDFSKGLNSPLPSYR